MAFKDAKHFVLFSFSVVAYYATDWNLDSDHWAELWLQNKYIRWCLTSAGSHHSSAERIVLQLTYEVLFYFYCCHVQSPLLLTSSLSFPTSQRDPSSDINPAVNQKIPQREFVQLSVFSATQSHMDHLTTHAQLAMHWWKYNHPCTTALGRERLKKKEAW